MFLDINYIGNVIGRVSNLPFFLLLNYKEIKGDKTMKNIMKKIGNKLVKVVVYICIGFVISSVYLSIRELVIDTYRFCFGG